MEAKCQEKRAQSQAKLAAKLGGLGKPMGV
jgi:hypothetical protein